MTNKEALCKFLQEIQARKETHLNRLIVGGLLKRSDAYQILCGFTRTMRFVSHRLSQTIEKEVVLLAILAYLTML